MEEAVAALYRLPVGEFVAARDQLARQLRAAGRTRRSRLILARSTPLTVAPSPDSPNWRQVCVTDMLVSLDCQSLPDDACPSAGHERNWLGPASRLSRLDLEHLFG